MPSVVVVGTYPPTECGIATYTANVRAALDATGVDVAVLRLVEGDADTSFPVVATWSGDSEKDVARAVAVANHFDAVLLQHEFGIYPGRDGVAVLSFVEACQPPVFCVLHTVLMDPSPSQRMIIERLARLSQLMIVHGTMARARLLAQYDVDPDRVVIVPHGAHLNLAGPAVMSAARPIVLTWGLLGPGKGIEFGIEATALLRDLGIEITYVVAGETHPNVLAREGERYRTSLMELARLRHVGDLVQFDDQYRDWQSLHALVRSATIVLLPYESRDQVTSGVLVEALAAGKPVVATAFPHALELACTGAVAVVSHDSPAQAATAIAGILQQPERHGAMSRAAALEAVRHDWANVGERLNALITTGIREATSDCALVHS